MPDVFRHVGQWVAARVERDAAIIAAEITQLILPVAQVAAKLVYEDQRPAVADFLVMEPDAVIGARERHGVAPGEIPGDIAAPVKAHRIITPAAAVQ